MHPEELAGNSDECVSDEEYDVTRSDLESLLRTKFGGNGDMEQEHTNNISDPNERSKQEEAADRSSEAWAIRATAKIIAAPLKGSTS